MRKQKMVIVKVLQVTVLDPILVTLIIISEIMISMTIGQIIQETELLILETEAIIILVEPVITAVKKVIANMIAGSLVVSVGATIHPESADSLTEVQVIEALSAHPIVLSQIGLTCHTMKTMKITRIFTGSTTCRCAYL